MISVDAPIGTFPVPSNAHVLTNITCSGQTIIGLTSVTPSQVSSFYGSALPRAGYTISTNTLIPASLSGLPGSAAEVDFTGHGLKGTIDAESNAAALASMPASAFPSGTDKNVAWISVAPPGEGAGCS
jgi:hypothetical protein